MSSGNLSPEPALYSVDLFDTLVERTLQRPVDVFELLQHTGLVRYRLPGLGLIGLRRWRMLAERLSRYAARLAGREDTTLAAIYRLLGVFILQPGRLMRRELALEVAVLKPVAHEVLRVQRLLDQGRNVCVISDMYLPAVFLRRIVRRALGRPVDVFVSSQYGLTKHSGKLFAVVAKHYRIGFTQILHRGDNPHADDSVPQRLGIATELISRPSPQSSVAGLFGRFAAPDLADDNFARLGYALVGPVCVAYARFLRDELKRRGLQKVFFCARDTWLIKEAFERLAPGVDSHYLRLSRRVLYVPAAVSGLGLERLFEGRLEAPEFFARLGLDCPPDMLTLNSTSHKAEFIAALERMNFRAHAEDEKAVLRSYLDAEGFHGDLALVDIGWRCTLQHSLAAITDNAAGIHGFYFGHIIRRATNASGYYVNACRPLARLARLFQALPVFEFLLTEPVQSVRRVRREGDKFAFDPVTDESHEQIRQRESIGRGCRRFFDDFSRVEGLLAHADDDYRLALDVLFDRYLLNPEPWMMAAFSSISHAEGFGGSRVGTVHAGGKFSLRGYRHSYWRAAYVKQAPGLKGRLGRCLHALVYSRPGMYLLFERRLLQGRL